MPSSSMVIVRYRFFISMNTATGVPSGAEYFNALSKIFRNTVSIFSASSISSSSNRFFKTTPGGRFSKSGRTIRIRSDGFIRARFNDAADFRILAASRISAIIRSISWISSVRDARVSPSGKNSSPTFKRVKGDLSSWLTSRRSCSLIFNSASSRSVIRLKAEARSRNSSSRPNGTRWPRFPALTFSTPTFRWRIGLSTRRI